MQNFSAIKSEMVSDETVKKLKQKLINELESVEFSPFINLNSSLTVLSTFKNLAFYSSYEINNESRSVSLIHSPSSENQYASIPEVTKDNIDKSSYKIDPKEYFYNHDVDYIVPKSSYIETCFKCKGSAEVSCHDCNGNSKCAKCSGNGDVNCSCRNGDCSDCNGKGEHRCTSYTCRKGTCSHCNGTGQKRDTSGNLSKCSNCWSTGSCQVCKGKGFNKCHPCSGSGKHSTCSGSGKLICKRCKGNGKCYTCRGYGKLTCKTCEGKSNLIYNLKITNSFSTSIDSFELISTNISPTKKIIIPDIAESFETIINLEKGEFSEDDINSLCEIIELKEFLKQRKNTDITNNIINERIKIIVLPIITFNYSIDSKEYISYFVGHNETHFFKSNPILDFNKDVDNKVQDLIKKTNYSEAVSLLKEQASRFGSIQDLENKERSETLLTDLKLEIQKDLMRGALIAQILFIFIDFYFLKLLFFSSGNDSADFSTLAIPLFLIRIGFYFKYLVPTVLFNKTTSNEINEIYNGDDKSIYYTIDTNLYKNLRVIGILSFIIVLINCNSNHSFNKAVISDSIVYALFFAVTLGITMFYDLYFNRKITESVLKIKSSFKRRLKTFSMNLIIYSISGVIVLFIASFFVDEVVNYGLVEIKSLLYYLLVFGAILFAYTQILKKRK